MKIRNITACLLIIIISLSFVSCRKKDTNVYMYHAVSGELKCADPQIAAGEAAKNVVNNCYDGLFYTGPDGTPQLASAESYEVSADGLVYTFRLRQGLKWKLTDDAQKALKVKLPEEFDDRVTARDFVFALRRAVDPLTGATDAVLLSPVLNAGEIMEGFLPKEELGVTALSDYVLEIRLGSPREDFLSVLAEPVCMPMNEVFFEACGGRYGLGRSYILSNGPFYLTRWQEDASVRLTKDADYAGSRPAIPSVVYLYDKDSEADMLARLEKGTYKSAFLSSAQYASLKKAKGFNYRPHEDTVWAFCFNLSFEVLSVRNVRSAICQSVSAELLEDIRDGRRAADRFFPAGSKPEFPKSCYLPAYNEKQARAKLEDGLQLLGRDNIAVTMLCLPEHEAALKLQIQEWQRVLGVNIIIRTSPVTMEEMRRAVNSSRFEMAFYPISISRADDFYKTFTSQDSRNIFKMKNEEYNLMFESLSRSLSDRETRDILSGLEIFFAEELPYFPMFYDNSYLAASNEIEGLYFNSSRENVYFHLADNNRQGG